MHLILKRTFAACIVLSCALYVILLPMVVWMAVFWMLGVSWKYALLSYAAIIAFIAWVKS